MKPALRTVAAALGLFLPLFAQGEEIASVPVPHPPPATRGQILDGIRRGVDYLLRSQHEDGSWGGPTRTKDLNIYAPLPGAHLAFRAGASALALCGVMDSADPRQQASESITRGTHWLETEASKLRRADQTTTYNVWGHAYALHAACRIFQRADAAGKERICGFARQQLDLLHRYEDINGGWSYLDFEFYTQRPSGLPTSFTTATVLLAMRQTEQVMGLSPDQKTVASALALLRLLRTPDSCYVYAYPHRLRPAHPINRPEGSVGRSQACNAALRAYGDPLITDAVLETWTKRFFELEKWLDVARKRPIPHESFCKVAGYFYYYGVYYFAESVRFLPKEKQAEVAPFLASILLSHQEKDGSWWDYPLYDYHQAYGTGFALMTLAWCRDVMAPAVVSPVPEDASPRK